ncbi:MAG: 23S rRNA (uracil(1939)-C(5))-methyltransferase RlmD [Clostridiales bacterium]|nr:23S rRNA (uracil(1939)-C(5))-methyltransferase RlmD [Clostridiales bacterium]
MNSLGVGVARLQLDDNTSANVGSVVVFVQGGCTGDVCEVKIIKVASSYLVARIEKLLEPSPYRVEPDCKLAKKCGGCVFRGISYAHELELKRGFVQSAMRKSGVDIEVAEVLSVSGSSGSAVGYRNKCQLPVGSDKNGNIVVGFYAERTHEIIPLYGSEGCDSDCKIQPRVFSEIAEFLRGWFEAHHIKPYDEVKHTGSVRHLYFRRSESTDEVMVCVVNRVHCEWMNELSDGLRARFSEVASVYENINPDRTNVVLGREYRLISGSEKLRDRLCVNGRERTFDISPESFWQVNRTAAELLYAKAGELADIKPGERVLDLFCGIGTIGMSVCPPENELYGIEIVEAAVENARGNAQINGCTKAQFSCCDAADADAIDRELDRIGVDDMDVILLDPPRKGCAPELLERLARTRARIVYISCNPETLARDLARMRSLGYECSRVTPVDMFPRTGHVECVVRITPAIRS